MFATLKQIFNPKNKDIRKKIEDDSKNPKYIHTVEKVGYKFDEK